MPIIYLNFVGGVRHVKNFPLSAPSVRRSVKIAIFILSRSVRRDSSRHNVCIVYGLNFPVCCVHRRVEIIVPSYFLKCLGLHNIYDNGELLYLHPLFDVCLQLPVLGKKELYMYTSALITFCTNFHRLTTCRVTFAIINRSSKYVRNVALRV